ncbi:GPW/gp25 family protein [Flavobacteriaceae bacterium]|nr:GPW/gp25 family protein [Flavobacteriaceae bacterium]MDC1460374.1 GPW/gp25 family protein [Flavobacteriaceae bacterium]
MQEKSFLGIGWSFPPTFNKERSDVEMTTKEEDIKQSLHIYFNTKLGERIMRQDFGCIIHEHLFDRLDKSILDVLTFELKQNIGNIEPRIIVNDISIMPIDINEGSVEININYTVITTNVRDNIVFPYYLNEGTNIKKD